MDPTAEVASSGFVALVEAADVVITEAVMEEDDVTVTRDAVGDVEGRSDLVENEVDTTLEEVAALALVDTEDNVVGASVPEVATSAVVVA